MTNGETQTQLVPFLRPRFAIERIHLELAARDYDSPEAALEQELALRIPYIPIAEHYAMGLMMDQGDKESMVRQDLLNKWDMQFNEGLAHAFSYLAEISSYPFELVAPGVYMASPNLDHNPAKLLLTDIVTQLDFNGLPVAMIPHVNQVVLTGSEDLIGLRLMLQIVQDLAAKPHGQMALPIVLSNNNWYPFYLTGDHELFESYDALRLEAMSSMYAEQKTLLQNIYAKNAQQVSVLDYARREVDEVSFSQTIVHDSDLPALLPLADSFEFRKMEENMPLKRVAHAGLERCLKVMSEILLPAGLYPERCKLEKFPDKKQCRSMGVDGFKSVYDRYITPAADPQKVVEEVLLLPIYPNSRPKGDSKEHQGRFTMDFLSTDPTSDVSEFYFEALNRTTSTCMFSHHTAKYATFEALTAQSQTLLNQMLALHYTGQAPAVSTNSMPIPDTYLLLDETQTVSRLVTLIRAQHNGTVIGLTKKSYPQEESRNRSVITIKDSEVLETVLGMPIHESFNTEGPCVNETHSITQTFKIQGESLQNICHFYCEKLSQGGWLTSSSSQSLLEAIKPTESLSLHIGKGIAGEFFAQMKRKQLVNVKPNVQKTEAMLDLEKRLGVELYADSTPEGRLQVRERVSEQKFVTRANPQHVARFFRCVLPQPIFIPLEEHRPNCWMVQAFNVTTAVDTVKSICILVMAGPERTQFVVQTTR